MSAVRQKRHSVHLPVGDAAGVSGLRRPAIRPAACHLRL